MLGVVWLLFPLVILMIEKLSKLVGLWEVEYLVTIRFTVENKELFNDMMGE